MCPEKILALFTNAQGELNVAALLVAKGIRQKDLAKKYFLDPTELNKVLRGKRKTTHVRQAIAIELEMSVEVLWGPDLAVMRGDA